MSEFIKKIGIIILIIAGIYTALGLVNGISILVSNSQLEEAKSNQIKASLSQLRVEAEMRVDSDGNYKDFITKPDKEVGEVIKVLTEMTQNNFSYYINEDAFKFEAKLPNNRYYCMDSEGYANELSDKKGVNSKTCT